MPDPSVKSSAAQWRMPGAGAVLLTLGGLGAAFGVASCCALPLLLATAGLGTAWLGGIALAASPHRTVLLAVAALCLAGGAVLQWRQRRAALCVPDAGAFCARPVLRGLTMLGLLLGVVLLALGYAYA